jgi:hypothetical protein
VLRTAFSALVARLLECNVVLGDLNGANLVLRDAGAAAARLVVIDGFGEKNLVPLRSMSRRWNRCNTRRLARRLEQALESGSAP